MIAGLDLDRAALEIARIEYPELDVEFWIAELDRHAFAIAERAGDLADGKRFVESASAYLFEELGLRGNEGDYYNAANSCINRVLETGQGIPISLSVVYIEVARRLAKPVYGVNLPAHFIVRFDDGEHSTFIDPFHQGALLDVEGCCRLLNTDALDAAFLAPVSTGEIVLRMLRNLRHVYLTGHDSEKALRAIDLLIENDAEAVDEYKQRGAVLMHLQRMTEAAGAFRKYLELAPNAPDRERVEEQLRSLTFWIASRN